MWQVSIAETKILLVLCYYAIFGIASLTSFAVESANQEDQFRAIQQYFVCEAAGTGKECDLSAFDEFTKRELVAVVYMLFGLIPAVNLMFVINWTVAKKLSKRIWMRYFQGIFTSFRSVAIRTQGNNIQETEM